MTRQLKPVRWGRVPEIDKRLRVGTTAWTKQPDRLKHLSVWRYLHKLGTHNQIRSRARRKGVKPTSDLRLTQKLGVARVMGGLK